MALIPLNQVVTVTPASVERDKFDRPVKGATYELRCRFQEGTELVTVSSQGLKPPGTVVSSAKIYFDKLAPIRMGDLITYAGELGTVTYKPLTIEVKRGLSGAPILTVVSV